MNYIAVLCSGGLDSAVLVALALQQAERVVPIYVAVGFAWENEERRMLDRLLAAPPFAGRVQPLVGLRFDMGDVFPPTHWAIRGEPPAFDTPDEDVYLDGRNIILLSKAAVYMAQQGSPVALVVRRASLEETMSRYLIDRVEAHGRRLHDRRRVPHRHPVEAGAAVRLCARGWTRSVDRRHSLSLVFEEGGARDQRSQ